MSRLHLVPLAVVSFLFLLPAPSGAFSKPALEMIDTFVRREAERASARNQAENDAMSDATTSIVERSSVSDFVGLALTLAGLQAQTGDEERANAASATASAAALLGLVTGHGVQDDVYYDDSSFLRNVAFTIGYDDPEDDEVGDATLLGMQIRLISDSQVWEKWRLWGNNEPVQFAPAVMLDSPTLSVFRPQDLPLAINGFAGESFFNIDSADEKQRLESLRSAGRRADWASEVCQGRARPAAGGAKSDAGLVSEFFGEDGARGSDRLAVAMHYAVGYSTWLLCQDPEDWTAKSASKTNVVAAVKGGSPSDEAEFHRVVESASMAAADAEEPERRSLAEGKAPEMRSESSDYLKLEATDEKTLTTFGQAVRLWALGKKKNDALDLLKKFIEERGEYLGKAKNATFKKRAGALVDEMNKRTELTLKLDSKLRNGGDDEYSGKFVLEASPFWDCGNGLSGIAKGECNYLRYLNFTLNAGVDYMEQRGEDALGGVVGVEVQMPFSPSFILPGRQYQPSLDNSGSQLSFSGRAKWMRNMGDQYVAQAKLEIPLGAGVKLPLSVSVANRTELVQEQETEVRGIVGFSVDTNVLANFLETGLAPN